MWLPFWPLIGSDDQICGAQWSSEELVVRNARLEEPFQLDLQGFELHRCPTAVAYEDFFLEENILRRYYPEAGANSRISALGPAKLRASKTLELSLGFESQKMPLWVRPNDMTRQDT